MGDTQVVSGGYREGLAREWWVGIPIADLVVYWVSRDVGIVEELVDDTYRLEGYFGRPVAVSSLSWGAVEALFRN